MSAEQKGDKYLIWSMTSQKFMKLTQNGVELSGTGNKESSKWQVLLRRFVYLAGFLLCDSLQVLYIIFLKCSEEC